MFHRQVKYITPCKWSVKIFTDYLHIRPALDCRPYRICFFGHALGGILTLEGLEVGVIRL